MIMSQKLLMSQLVLTNIFSLINQGIYNEEHTYKLIINVSSLILVFTLFLIDYLHIESNSTQIGLILICIINSELIILNDTTVINYFIFGHLVQLIRIQLNNTKLFKILQHTYILYFTIRILAINKTDINYMILIICYQPFDQYLFIKEKQKITDSTTQTYQERVRTVITQNLFNENHIDEYQELAPSTSRRETYMLHPEQAKVILEDLDKRQIVKKCPFDNIQMFNHKKSIIEKPPKYSELISILNCLPFGVLFLDIMLNVLNHNTRLETYLGVDQEEQILDILNFHIQQAEIYEIKSSAKGESRKTKREKIISNKCSIHQLVKDLTNENQEKSPKSKQFQSSYSNLKTILNKIPNSQKSLMPESNHNYIIRINDKQDSGKLRCLKMRVFSIENRAYWQDKTYLLLFENITKKEEAKLLNDKVKFQQSLLNSLCHELRTPMNGTLSQLSALMEKLPPNLITQYVKPALTSAKRLQFQLNDIMDYAQILCDNFKLNMINFNSLEICENIQELFQLDCEFKQIKLIIEGIWNHQICSDKERILRILINLIENAIKFTDQGGSIILAFQLKNEILYFSVMDNGMGMTQETLKNVRQLQENICQDFCVQSSNKLGLGLRISQQIAKQMCIDKKLNIESLEHQYTKITFDIQNQSQLIEIKSSQRISNQKKVCDCIKILIVDDISTNHLALQILLKKYNLITDCAYNGEAALKKVNEKLDEQCCKYYKLIFMDIEMPIKNGFTASKEIQQLLQQHNFHQQCVIVMYSAYSGDDDQSFAQSCGMKEVAKKPLEPTRLEYLIGKYIF